MALWQFDLRVGPRHSFRANDDVPIVRLSDEEDIQRRLTWCDSRLDVNDLVFDLSDFLVEGTSWANDLRWWGEEDGDRVDLYFTKKGLEEWGVYIDVRVMNNSFLQKILAIATKNGALLVTRDGQVFAPSYSILLRHIYKSDTFEYVRDPTKFLEQME